MSEYNINATVNPKNFRTPTKMIKTENVKAKSGYPIALDLGYSGVKGFAPNKIFCFPAYAKQVEGEQLNIVNNSVEDHVLYKADLKGPVWSIGADAQNMISSNETEDSEALLYGRNRYFSPIFKVVSETALGISLKENSYGKYTPLDSIYLQTGLPSRYMADASDLTESLMGHHDFYLKFGSKPWEHYVFDISEENIFIMPQPMGTLQSICTSNTGAKIFESKNYFSKNLLIIDPGFGTLDTFSVMNGYPKGHETYADLGMKAILQEVSEKIFTLYKQRIPVPVMQKYLETGEIKVIEKDKGRIKTSKKCIDDILLECSQMICERAIDKIMTVYNNLFEYDYIVITGGTGAAWFSYISNYFDEMETLKVIAGNQNNTSLDFIFANARGYYMSLIDRLKAMARINA